MNEKELYLRYGEILGRIKAVTSYCNTTGYVDKDVVLAMIGISDNVYREFDDCFNYGN